jgi:DNA repair exonuclease SbcCD nuclease subunit
MNNKNIVLISDLHLGVKKNNNTFLRSQINFLRNQLVPYLKDNGIEFLCILGDIFDNRNSINTLIQNEIFNLFANDFSFLKKIYVIIGNHDTYYNNSIYVNSLKFLSKFENVILIEEVSIIEIYDKKILMVPWIVDQNSFSKSFETIKENFDICFGHFNITGFNFNKYKLSEDGLSDSIFNNKVKKVFSGHFHIKSKQTKGDTEIIYIGSPYQITRNDIDEQRGFCIVNLENLNYNYINNDLSLKYIQLNYPDKFSEKTIKGNIIDIYIEFNNSYNEKKIEKYIKDIEFFQPADKPNIFVVNKSDIDGDLSIDGYNIKSIIDLMKDYVYALESIKNKDEIYNILLELYQESKGDI